MLSDITGTLLPFKNIEISGEQRYKIILLNRELQATGANSVSLETGFARVRSQLRDISKWYKMFDEMTSQQGDKRAAIFEEMSVDMPPLKRIGAGKKGSWIPRVPYHSLHMLAHHLGPSGILSMGQEKCNSLLECIGRGLKMESTAEGGGKSYVLKEEMKGAAGSSEKSARALCYFFKLGDRGGNADRNGHYDATTINSFTLPEQLCTDGVAFQSLDQFFEEEQP